MKYNKTKYPNIYTYKTKKGKRYYVRRAYYLDGKKKEVSKSNLKNLQEARSVLAEIERMIEADEFSNDKNLTVSQYWEIYVDNRLRASAWAPDTLSERSKNFKNHLLPKFGNQKINSINRIEYENFINDLLATHSKSTVKHLHDSFNIMLTHAVKNNVLKKNNIEYIDIGKSTISPINKRRSIDEFKAWDKVARKTLNDYDYTMVRITYLGLRKSEVAGIKIGNIDFKSNNRAVIKIDESRTRMRPKGGGLKTVASERFVQLDIETSKLLKQAIDRSHKIAFKNNRILNKNDFLFLIDTIRGKKSLKGQPIYDGYIYSLFKKVNDKCNVSFSPHIMRHFFATQGQIAGVPVEHMASALGHSTSYMTQKYTHIADEVAESVTDLFMQSIN
ncbi:tyrosine-type recombinase/integrase [Streptococcus dysgalactiae]|uniref:Phage integrase n=1 Tax=Streptococcus dysgalactiae subsp. equisimilis TaxID=119602 RepID=A0A9X8T3W3_STREQ|nr:site-specific integrase [Streptococcus dysgalactiae]SUN64454.1 phage integrase [Streptococcus dysgalactiae subsp. equisimilis]